MRIPIQEASHNADPDPHHRLTPIKNSWILPVFPVESMLNATTMHDGDIKKAGVVPCIKRGWSPYNGKKYRIWKYP